MTTMHVVMYLRSFINTSSINYSRSYLLTAATGHHQFTLLGLSKLKNRLQRPSVSKDAFATSTACCDLDF